MFDRSSMLANPRGIDVRMDGNVVVLRGTVRDEDEAKTAEGMVRLTPGVLTVRNELTYPNP
jgi:osmotically-inducible protein OsmY